MKILMVNKFLYPNGGSETYIFKLGEYLNTLGHEVQFFGMEHEGRIVGNHAESYTSDMDFHTGKLQKLLYPFKIIYSVEARKKIRKVLDDFKPDVVHLNNFNFQLTPSIIYEIKKDHIPIVYTAHDSQLICPNHLMKIPSTGELCDRCCGRKFSNCTKYKCLHDSKVKSLLATLEADIYKWNRAYRKIDTIICPSVFLKTKLETNADIKDNLVVMHNFIDEQDQMEWTKKEYVLYFGRYSEEKGIDTLLNVCKKLPDIPFIFAGNGPMESEVNSLKNVRNVGFQTGEKLKSLIAEAQFSLFTSRCYENCPFSVMESINYGTPVIGADIGGVPELIDEGKTGELFTSGDERVLQKKIEELWKDKTKVNEYSKNCKRKKFDTIEDYCDKILKLYKKGKE